MKLIKSILYICIKLLMISSVKSKQLKGDPGSLFIKDKLHQTPKSNYGDTNSLFDGEIANRRDLLDDHRGVHQEKYLSLDVLDSQSLQPHSRSKRVIVFPKKSKFTVENELKIETFSKFDGDLSGLFKGQISVQYTFPDDASVGKKKRSIGVDRFHTYNSMISLIDSFGFNGTACLLRSVCEIANDPLSEYGILGEILAMVLTPSHNVHEAHMELREFTMAEHTGRTSGECHTCYHQCPYDLDQMIFSSISAFTSKNTRTRLFE